MNAQAYNTVVRVGLLLWCTPLSPLEICEWTEFKTYLRKALAGISVILLDVSKPQHMSRNIISCKSILASISMIEPGSIFVRCSAAVLGVHCPSQQNSESAYADSRVRYPVSIRCMPTSNSPGVAIPEMVMPFSLRTHKDSTSPTMQSRVSVGTGDLTLAANPWPPAQRRLWRSLRFLLTYLS